MCDAKQDFAVQRAQMVAKQIEGRGIHDEAILAAMGMVPRHCFVEEPYIAHAYSDTPLPIPHRQTISQPYVVALMIKYLQLSPNDRVLEIGTGSGYAAALLSRIVSKVITIERHKDLVDYARERLDLLGYDNVEVVHGDGTLGRPEQGPYDGIIVAAGGPAIPLPLKQQLALGGRLVMPIGRKRRRQELICLTRHGRPSQGDEFSRQELGPVAFVPLVGVEGWEK